MFKFLIFLLLTILASCSNDEVEKAKAVGRLSVYISKIDNGDTAKKIREIYPHLQIGLIYYDPIDDNYKAVDPRKGFEKLGYSSSFNREVFYYVMYKLTGKALKEENDFVKKQLIRTLSEYQNYLKEAEITEKEHRKMIKMILTYGPAGIIVFALLVGSGIAYLLYSIASKHVL